MSEARKTAMFSAVALALVLLAWATAPHVRTPEAFAERGQALFPQFTDPNAAASLEVIQFDAQLATVRPFKVQNRNGRWTIPSQHDYPTDAKDRLSQTAAAIIALRRDDFVTDDAGAHERCGVLDPLDTTLPGVTGRGTHIIVRGAQDQRLADVIVGSPVEGRPGFRYIRQADERRVYISNVGDLKLSTSFGDWIERDLLEVTADEIDAVNLRNYAVNRTTKRIDAGETLLLEEGGNDRWTINGLSANEQLDLGALSRLLTNLTNLTIVGVLPKPAGITATLRGAASSATIAPDEKEDLARKGFYLARDGQLVSNRGELVVRTVNGVYYTLRFGDVAPEADAPASNMTPVPAAGGQTPAAHENRYLFIMVDFDPKSARTPAQASDGAAKAQVLRARFAPWYYVIAAGSFADIRPQRSNLITRRASATAR